MAEKKGFLLRLNPEILVELERWAQDEFRSVNGQIEFLLSDALKKRRRTQPKPGTSTTGTVADEPDAVEG